ncbi:amino acid adenylation domain-containing protein, partial [bacterium]|nr:amino acid adenylation domain-containing protein [bacterium]
LLSLSLPYHLAYVIYTSGSTGKPKGVENTHYGLKNRLDWTLLHYPITEKSSLLHIAAMNFDISVWEILFPLTVGASLVLAEKNKDVLSIISLINTYKITTIHFVPSLLNLFINLKDIQRCQSLTQVITGGESLTNEISQKFISNFKYTNLYLAYGPTEAAISVTHWDCHNKEHENKIPIGRPISNTEIYILDNHQNPVPVGVNGEIYIGGAGLARGYLNRPDLTAEKFVPNPFIREETLKEKDKTHQSLRLYRTGDLARYLPDGNIEFIGRIDDQVKIRGFRIELGEIESTLLHHGDVNQAVVIAREDEPGHKQLVAYVMPQERILSSLDQETLLTSSAKEDFAVLKGEKLPSLTEDLRQYLALSLPDYMIPSFFVFIDKIPLTSNGKIDRKALPTPDLSLRQVGDEYVAPQTTLQQELCAIWSEVLRIEKIGIYDNFFKLGGHSLLATQVISRIRHTYTIDLPLRALFEHPTLQALSQDIEQLTEKSLSLIPPIVVQQRPDALPLSFAQQRLWFLDQLLPNTAHYNVPLALKLTGSLNLQALEQAFNALISRHEILRTLFPTTDGEAHQLILPHLSIDIENCLLDLSSFSKEQQEDSVKTFASQEANKPFNLSSGPLIRLKLLHLSSQEHILLITMHHIISDGWSMGIFFKELSELYNAYQENRKPNLSPLPIQYADFALWQRQWLQGDVLEAQLSYWKHQLTDIPDLLEFPTDKPRPKELTYQGATYHYVLSKEIKDQLNQLSQQQGTSLFMTLLAIFQVLLYRYTGQKDIVVGSPIANRHYQEIEGLIGFFVNTLALKTSFGENESFLEVLHQVKE